MPAIFISHSSQDNRVSGEIKAWLGTLGFESIFVDFDEDTGFYPGDDWEKRLYTEISRCHAIILVVTPNWLASKWCFAELTQARALGKVVVPAICRPIGKHKILPDIQAVDLTDWNAEGLKRIEQRLHAITDEVARGFRLPAQRPPYPGIHSFEAEDAAIYFGRDEEVEELVRPEHSHHSPLVRLACADDDAQGQTLDVFWNYELDRRILKDEGWQDLAAKGFDAPLQFAAFLHTLQWNCVTATDPNLFQAPFRAGIKIDAYQMEPLRKALHLPRVNLFIADDTGLGKTIEAGLIARELLLRKKAKAIVVAVRHRDEVHARRHP
jgi:TIR domain